MSGDVTWPCTSPPVTPSIAIARAGADIRFGADLGGEVIEDVVADERIEHRVAVVAAAEVRVAIVDLEMSDAERRVLHDVIEQRIVDRRRVDEQIAVLDPRLLVMARREVRRHRDADARGDLGVHVEIRDGVVEAVADPDELILIDAVDDDGVRVVVVIEALELLRERAAEREREAVERHLIFLRRLEDVEAALIGRTDVIDVHRPVEADLRRACLRGGVAAGGRGGRAAIGLGGNAGRNEQQRGEAEAQNGFHMKSLQWGSHLGQSCGSAHRRAVSTDLKLRHACDSLRPGTHAWRVRRRLFFCGGIPDTAWRCRR